MKNVCLENNCYLGENIIYLISQPRAGSTLTQRIFGSHSNIHTLPETWLMLHPLYAIRSEGHSAEYNTKQNQSILGIKQFLQFISDGYESYYEALRIMHLYLYSKAIQNTKKKYFLDKTPRYYFVINDLKNVFPKAKYIVLYRNPIAVLCSIVSTWTKENWLLLKDFKSDLLEAPFYLVEGKENFSDDIHILYYEHILENPSKTIEDLCIKLNVNFEPQMLTYGTTCFPEDSIFGDKKKVNSRDKTETQNLDKWINLLIHPQMWRVADDYLEFLGEDILSKMGYSYNDLKDTLILNKPSYFNLLLTVPLELLLLDYSKSNKLLFKKVLVKLVLLMQKIIFRKSIYR